MGTFLFQWPHAANDVHVTGTFDDWSKSVELEKNGNVFEKLVTLPKADVKILYKFVVNGEWIIDPTAPTESDSSGNTNNVLTPDKITKPGEPALLSALSSNTATNTTTQALAGQVPKESVAESVPGAFPETPAAGEAEMKVNPFPATAGAGNPVSVKPGEPVPAASSITANTVAGTATTDKESYEKADSGAPVLPNVVTPENERTGGLFGLAEKAKNLIPESSLPIVGGIGTSTINSAGAGSTTAELAGQVPKETGGVPEVVKESQAEAHVSPEASANPEAVQEKSKVEKELESKVPEEPAATESTIGGKAAAALGAATAAVTGAAAVIADKVGANGAVSNGAPKDSTAVAAGVPNTVQESLAKAHQSPEAAADATAVKEKEQVETELLSEVKPDNSAGAPAPVTTAETSAEAPKATGEVRDSARDEAKPPVDSRDISPMTRQDGTHIDRPAVTTGLDSAAAPAKSTPETPLTPKSTDDKKSKRRSGFFHKLLHPRESKKN